MSHASHYEIIVSLNGKHLFATAERSITTPDSLDATMRLFQAKFPASEGFALSATYWVCRGEPVTPSTFEPEVTPPLTAHHLITKKFFETITHFNRIAILDAIERAYNYTLTPMQAYEMITTNGCSHLLDYLAEPNRSQVEKLMVANHFRTQ